MQYIVNTSRLLVLNYFIIDNDVKDNAHNITHTHACIYTIKYKTYLAHTYHWRRKRGGGGGGGQGGHVPPPTFLIGGGNGMFVPPHF